MILAALVAGLAARGLDRAVALTYHDVVDARGPESVWFDCTAREFAEQMEWLKRQGGRFVSVADVERALGGGSLPPHAVCVTFADGYEGFFRNALPVLRRMKIPATMFVHTGFVGSPVGRPKMTWAELKQAAATGLVTVASQTVSHPADLRRLSDAQLAKEFSVSKRSIESRFGVCRYLAYPNGKYDARVASAARKAGYALAFTEELRPLAAAPDRWRLPRWVHTKYRIAWRIAARR